jgi:transcriptional regulator with XRE-family HTH domain
MEIKDRIEHVLRAQNITATQLAEMMGIQRSGISHILSGRNNPSMDFIVKFKESFPEYNLEWLLLGNGPKTGYEQVRQQKLHVPIPDLFEAVAEKKEIESFQNDEQKAAQVSELTETNKDGSQVVAEIEDFSEDFQEKKIAPAKNEQVLQKDNPIKHVKRIIFFYSDGSFEMFHPSS